MSIVVRILLLLLESTAVSSTGDELSLLLLAVPVSPDNLMEFSSGLYDLGFDNGLPMVGLTGC